VTDPPLSRFLELCAREMDAESVEAEVRGSVEPSPIVLVAHLNDETDVVVRFSDPPSDIDARRRRLEMLASAFASAIEGGVPRAPPGRRSLRRELEAMAHRADALDAIVIDAHSPIVWGASGPMASPMANVFQLNPEAKERVERIHDSHRDLIASLDPPQSEERPDRQSATPAPGPPSRLSLRAVAEVRALPATAQLHRGGHLAYSVRGPNYGVIARSFAAIYVLVLVFDKVFDEIRAERSLREDLPTIERLVLALPPMDPEPTPHGGVIALRKPRRRR
jgi:hypothetical protein